MRRILAVLVSGIFFSTAAVVVRSSSANAQDATNTTVPAEKKERGEHHEHREHHKKIHEAISKLKKAKEDLEKATHDFGGHRAKAIQAIDQALQELKMALESDKK